MKKILFVLLIAAFSGVFFVSCSDSKMEELYPNPDLRTTAKIEYLFTQLQTQNANYIWTYWDMGTMVLQHLSVYAQTGGYIATNDRFTQNVSYLGDRWRGYYNGLGTFREMELLLPDVDPTMATGYDLIVNLGKAICIHETQKATDLWGDMPYSQGGRARGENKIIFPEYDSQEAIYTSMLTDLKSISEAISRYQTNAYDKKATFEAILATQDFMFHGNLDSWKKFVNSLRLRVAMRISNVNETLAKATITEVLGNPSQYPVIETNAENAFIASEGNLLANTGRHEQGVKGALTYQTGKNLAPGLMVSMMKNANDPRLTVYFGRNKEGNVIGVDQSMSQSEQEALFSAELYSHFDTCAVFDNDLLPNMLINAAEVSFLKAEAYERWGGGDAQAAYENGIRLSVEYWFGLQTGTGVAEPTPDAAIVDAMIASDEYKYSNNPLKQIATQKWMDFGLLNTYEAWAEQRRTGFPVFADETAGTVGEFQKRPFRLTYPSTEISYNGANYEKVRAKDKPTVKLWWDVN